MATNVEAQAASPTQAAASQSAIERFFDIRERGTSVGTEVRGGLTTLTCCRELQTGLRVVQGRMSRSRS